MKLLRYHLHYSQWHPWVCLDLLAQFPNSAWGFLSPICPKEHSMYFYHHYQWPVVKNTNIHWFQILFWNHGKFCFEIMVIKSCDDALSQAEHWECSKLCPLWTVFISCVRHVSPIMNESILTLSVIILIITISIMDKSPWESNAIFLFFVILGSLIKQCILFEINFSCSSSPTLYKVEIQKKFWIHASNIVWGVRGGVGPVWIGNAQKCKSVPRLLSMIVVGR